MPGSCEEQKRRSFVAVARRLLWTSCVAVAGWLLCEPGHAFDLFGLFGSDNPPPVSATALSYRLDIEARTANGKRDGDAEQALRDASASYRLRQDPPPDGEGLARRLQADINPRASHRLRALPSTTPVVRTPSSAASSSASRMTWMVSNTPE